MKAIVKSKAAKGLWLEELPLPELTDRDVLVKIKKSAICGTDLHIYEWDEWARKNVIPGTVIGHEYLGTIVEMGRAATRFKIGDRVSGEGHITCGFCKNCRTGNRHFCQHNRTVGIHRAGCFADYLVVPEENIYLLEGHINDDLGAIMDPFGNATHCVRMFDTSDNDVLITGAGPIGVMAVAIAKHLGARHVVITDVVDYRLELARKLGATRAVHVGRESLTDVMKELGIVEGFEVGCEMSGAPQALQDIINKACYGSKIALLGLLPKNTSIDWFQVIEKGLTLQGIYGRQIFNTWFQMDRMVQTGLNINPVITHRLPADKFQEGFDLMLSKECGKVILNWE
ncbi:L-threonine 3-dehydrogenase [Simkania negevensis]|uniref:L-threonine 3-dehydrogenase n=1 Tax=Simkania negevensis TaxID=83561 RepID=A0ABS3ATK5_9BACT|nr:L-threonine 3-dehydrogenase [Simkania negevensis]